jgi:hypothetical protein
VVTTDVNVRKRFYRQCYRCGEKSAQLKQADVTDFEQKSAQPADDGIRRRWYERRSARYSQLQEAARQEEQDAWWERYEAYLESPKWKLKSRMVVKRDKVCQACLSRPAVQAHHKSYKYVFDEPLFDLVGVCLQCHHKLHDAEARPTP